MRKMGAGTLGTSGELLALDYGKTSENNGAPFLKTPLPPQEMVGGWVFGRTLGAVRPCWVTPSPLCSIWQFTKMLGWQMFGIPQGRMGVSPQFS